MKDSISQLCECSTLMDLDSTKNDAMSYTQLKTMYIQSWYVLRMYMHNKGYTPSTKQLHCIYIHLVVQPNDNNIPTSMGRMNEWRYMWREWRGRVGGVHLRSGRQEVNIYTESIAQKI